jgi:hypothetical protein
MAAKSVEGNKGKKPASAAVNLIGKMTLFVVRGHFVGGDANMRHSWWWCRYDGGSRLPSSWYGYNPNGIGF